MNKKFSYDDLAPIFALGNKEREIAMQLNEKGYYKGLTEDEYKKITVFIQNRYQYIKKKEDINRINKQSTYYDVLKLVCLDTKKISRNAETMV